MSHTRATASIDVIECDAKPTCDASLPSVPVKLDLEFLEQLAVDLGWRITYYVPDDYGWYAGVAFLHHWCPKHTHLAPKGDKEWTR